jgi:hypothetical protein
MHGYATANVCVAGGKSNPYYEIRKAYGMVWVKNVKSFSKRPFESPVPGSYNGTINSESGYGDISVLARSNILKNDLDPRWSTVQIPLHW